jgi:hypothetical protein
MLWPAARFRTAAVSSDSRFASWSNTSDLALALANAATVDEAISAYENTMLPRSAEFARMLDGRAEDLLSADVPDFGADGDIRS